MQITRSGDYGLRGVLFLAKQSPKRLVLVSEISRDQRIPETFLAKIFQRLSKAGVLRSVRGVRGGFTLGRPAKDITIRQVIEALDGPIALNRCLMERGECEDECVCPLHQALEEAQRRLLEVLDGTTMEDLTGNVPRKPSQGAGGKGDDKKR